MDAPAAIATPAKSGLVPMLIIALVVCVVLGGAGFGIAYFMLPGAKKSGSDSTSPATTEHTTRSAAEVAAQGGRAVTKFTIEEVTVNVAETRGSRYVRVGAFFEAEPAVLEELEANRARIVDTLEQILSTKTLDDLTSPSIRAQLREQLLGTLNPTLKQGRIDNIYFTDLLVQ